MCIESGNHSSLNRGNDRAIEMGGAVKEREREKGTRECLSALRLRINCSE